METAALYPSGTVPTVATAIVLAAITNDTPRPSGRNKTPRENKPDHYRSHLLRTDFI